MPKSQLRKHPLYRYLGTIVGAVLGLVLLHGFGFLVLGALVGYGVDVMRHQRQRDKRAANRSFVEPLFALLGAVAKSDGRVSEREIAVAEGMMRRWNLDKSWRERAISAFNRGKQAGFDPRADLQALRDWTGGYRDLAHPMLDVLVDTVLADGQPSQNKINFLHQVARGLGISDLQLVAMIAMKGAAQARSGNWQAGPRPGGAGAAGGSRRGTASRGFSDPYAVLGLTRDADNASIKRTYRKLMSEHHPDRLGELPEDLRRRAEERASAINAAYDQIKQQRGIK